ncbi:hypothetical protein L7F22_015907 [Adiantum nelumboides]|nr:hypothetical protein [Adiantum nelumboides]
MEGRAKAEYAKCVKITTDASIQVMIPLGVLVMLTPLVVGILFGTKTLAELLVARALVFGVQPRALANARTLGPMGLDAHKAAVIGDTIGDPIKGHIGALSQHSHQADGYGIHGFCPICCCSWWPSFQALGTARS